MRHALLFVLPFVMATPAFAQDDHDDHDHHAVEESGISAIHAWTNATTESLVLVYVDIENLSDSDVLLLGAETDIAATATLVGLDNADGTLAYTAIPQMPVAAGSELVLSPNGLAIQLEGVSDPLREGETFEMELQFEALHLDVVVDIEPADAIQHSHAGHEH